VGTDHTTDHLMMRPIHIITPETSRTSHYIWGLTRNVRLEDDYLDGMIFKAVSQTFDEDRALLQAQQRYLESEDWSKIPQMATKEDKAPVQGRRLLEAMIER
jgi:phenylpropionate dioxygenase-like ring-hydroxylating dioxygenase large terminal subunit